MAGGLRRAIAGSLGITIFLIPLYPAFITLTAAHVPGESLVAKPLLVVLLALLAAIAAGWTTSLLAAPREPMPTVLPLATFPAAAALAAILGLEPLAGALFVAILAGGVIWHAAILRFAQDRDTLLAIFRAYMISGALAALVAIVMVLTKTPPEAYTIGHGRATGTFVVPGELAGYLIIYVPVAFAFVRSDLGLRALAAAGLALGSVALVMTFSRAGWIGLAAAVAVFVLVRRRRAGARYAIAAMGTALVAVLLVFNAHHDPSENFTRLSIWDAALQTVLRFPFTGVGPFEFAHFYPFVRVPGGEPVAHHAHGVLLTIAAEAGFVGIAALLFGWWRFVAELRVRLRAPSDLTRVAVAIAAGLAGTLVQGLIDTVSVVIFGLWLPFMALALACAGADPRPRTIPFATPRGARAARIALAAVAALLAVLLLFIQSASDAVYAGAAAPFSLARHLPPQYGTRSYEALDRVAPLPFVETVLAEDALRRGDVSVAASYTAHLRGPMRSELIGRIALAENRRDEAMHWFLDAADDEALQPLFASLVREGRIREAYELEGRLTNRLLQTETRPNAAAESFWRRGHLALRLGKKREAGRYLAAAFQLAPLNTKYLRDNGTFALDMGDPAVAQQMFARAIDVDPQDADAFAGLGLVALRTQQDTRAIELSAKADAIDPRAPLARRLRDELTQSAKKR